MLLKAWRSTPSGVALQLVRSILNESASPLTTKQIYEEAIRREAGTKYPHPPSLSLGASVEQPKELKNKRGVVHKAPPPPPHPDHAIRSIKYLKTVVLPHMQDNTQEIEKFHSVQTMSEDDIERRLATLSKSARKAKGNTLPTTGDVWLWRTRTRPPLPPVPEKETSTFGAEVGVGEDQSHLNKRRQRARTEKVARDLGWLHEVMNIRREQEALKKAAEKTVA